MLYSRLNYDSDKNCCKGVIQNNQVVTISGLMQVNNRNDELQIIVDKCKQTKNMPQVLLLNGDYMLMAEALERIEPYRTQTDGIDISATSVISLTKESKTLDATQMCNGYTE